MQGREFAPENRRPRVMGDHLIVMHSTVRGVAGYNRHEAPSILLDGTSTARETEHGRAVTAQLARRQNTLEEAIDAANVALAAAGVEKGIRRQARAACEDYFYQRLKLTPDLVLGAQQAAAEPLEPMPDAMAQVIENIVALIVDGEYDELSELSGDQLPAEDLRRRVEDDCPDPLILPDRDVYQVEAITKSDDADLPGWAYFLDLYTEDGPARLHVEGTIEESDDDRYVATLTDILP